MTAINTANRVAPARAEAKPAKKELEVKPELDNIADRYNGSRSLGNRVSGMILGATQETVATLAQSPRLAWEIAENAWQCDTVGPNIKILSTLAAIPGALLSIPAAPFYGAVKGYSASKSGEREEGPGLLTKDSSNSFAREVFTVKSDNEARTMSGGFIQGLEEWGDAKLAEGEKPRDIPLLSPVFSVTGGVVSGAISGVVGLVAGLVAGAITAGKDIGDAFTAEDKGFGARVSQAVLSPINLVAGPALAWAGLKRSVPQGFVDGWDHGPFKPVIDTTKASVALGGAAIKQAWER